MTTQRYRECASSPHKGDDLEHDDEADCANTRTGTNGELVFPVLSAGSPRHLTLVQHAARSPVHVPPSSPDLSIAPRPPL